MAVDSLLRLCTESKNAYLLLHCSPPDSPIELPEVILHFRANSFGMFLLSLTLGKVGEINLSLPNISLAHGFFQAENNQHQKDSGRN